jgi:hypothetical protein
MGRLIKVLMGVVLIVSICASPGAAQTTNRVDFTYDKMGNLTGILDATTVPQVPSNLQAYAGSTVVLIYWADNSDNETAFLIERKTGAGGTYTQIGQAAANATGYVDLGLTPNTTYYYRVRATGSVGNSPYSNEVSTTTLSTTVSAPSNLTATAVYASQVNLSWSDNSNNETSFTIERKTGASGVYAQIVTVGANSTTYADTSIAASTTYYYRVMANGSIYNSAYSNEASATTSATRDPSAPSGLTVTSAGVALTLKWTNNASNADGVAIERKIGTGGTYAEVGKAPRSPSGCDSVSCYVGTLPTSYNDKTVQPGVVYYYRVRAYTTAGGYTAYSNEASGMQPAASVPSGLTLTSAGVGLLLKWTNNASDADGVAIERKAGTGEAYAEIGRAAKPLVCSVTQGCTYGSLPLTYDDKTVQPGIIYYYRVRAYATAGGYTAYSNEVSGMQPAAAAPSGLTVASSGVALRLTWTNNASDADGVAIERKVGTAGAYAEIGRGGQ